MYTHIYIYICTQVYKYILHIYIHPINVQGGRATVEDLAVLPSQAAVEFGGRDAIRRELALLSAELRTRELSYTEPCRAMPSNAKHMEHVSWPWSIWSTWDWSLGITVSQDDTETTRPQTRVRVLTKQLLPHHVAKTS